MALTLEEASKLSNDVLMQGVVETIVKDSPVLQRLPFIEIVGNGLTYNQEKTLPSIDFYDVGDTWSESTPTFEQLTANLKIMGGDADVDNFLKSTRSNVQDLEAAVIELKAKALRDKFEDTFIYGDSAADAKQFDGLRALIDTETAGPQVIATGDTWRPLRYVECREHWVYAKTREAAIGCLVRDLKADPRHEFISHAVIYRVRPPLTATQVHRIEAVNARLMRERDERRREYHR